MKSNFFETFTKAIVTVLVLNGIAWIWCSYLLAYLGKDEIAETLSKSVAVEIIGVFLLYAVKSLFENLSKNNNWPDKKTSETANTLTEKSKY